MGIAAGKEREKYEKRVGEEQSKAEDRGSLTQWGTLLGSVGLPLLMGPVGWAGAAIYAGAGAILGGTIGKQIGRSREDTKQKDIKIDKFYTKQAEESSQAFKDFDKELSKDILADAAVSAATAAVLTGGKELYSTIKTGLKGGEVASKGAFSSESMWGKHGMGGRFTEGYAAEQALKGKTRWGGKLKEATDSPILVGGADVPSFAEGSLKQKAPAITEKTMFDAYAESPTGMMEGDLKGGFVRPELEGYKTAGQFEPQFTPSRPIEISLAEGLPNSTALIDKVSGLEGKLSNFASKQLEKPGMLSYLGYANIGAPLLQSYFSSPSIPGYQDIEEYSTT